MPQFPNSPRIYNNQRQVSPYVNIAASKTRGLTPIDPRQNPTQQAQPTGHWTQQLPFKRSYFKTLTRGSLVTAQYSFFKHDRTPLILVCEVSPEYIKGINLHYLNLTYVKQMLQSYCGKPNFGYELIKNNKLIANSFRTYKRTGLSNLSVLDCNVINQNLNKLNIRSLNPQEVKEIRKQIRESFKQNTNLSAKQMANTYINIATTKTRPSNQSPFPGAQQANVQASTPGSPNFINTLQ